MVKKISIELTEAIAKALQQAKHRTAAEIIMVVSPASDHYQGEVMAYGLALGSLISLGLWLENVYTEFPELLGIQIAVIATVNLIPALRGGLVKMIPKRILHHHAARRAMAEFVFEMRHVPAQRPAVMLYVSLAERYAHILHSRAVPEKVPGAAWEGVIKNFTGAVKSAGLQNACVTAIGDMAKILEESFPAKP